jgi:uncharacterized protein (DUF488 family)
MNLYTVGYEGVSVEDFIERIRLARVQLIVDVRDLPLSRKPGFSKSTLAQTLEAVGLEYRHMSELGCPKPIRDRYRADGDWDRYTASFMRHLHTRAAAVSSLPRVCTSATVALLCYEADPTRCHRRRARGLQICPRNKSYCT